MDQKNKMQMAKALITDYSDTIPEDSKEEYVKLIPLVFGDDKDAMQQAVMDMVKLVIKKFSVYLERKLNEQYKMKEKKELIMKKIEK